MLQRWLRRIQSASGNHIAARATCAAARWLRRCQRTPSRSRGDPLAACALSVLLLLRWLRRLCSCGSSRRGGALAPKCGSFGRNVRVRVVLDENVPPLPEVRAADGDCSGRRRRARREQQGRTVGESGGRRATARNDARARTLAKMNSCTEGWLKTYTAITGAGSGREEGRAAVARSAGGSGRSKPLTRAAKRRTNNVDGKLEALQPGTTHRGRCAREMRTRV